MSTKTWDPLYDSFFPFNSGKAGKEYGFIHLNISSSDFMIFG